MRRIRWVCVHRVCRHICERFIRFSAKAKRYAAKHSKACQSSLPRCTLKRLFLTTNTSSRTSRVLSTLASFSIALFTSLFALVSIIFKNWPNCIEDIFDRQCVKIEHLANSPQSSSVKRGIFFSLFETTTKKYR